MADDFSSFFEKAKKKEDGDFSSFFDTAKGGGKKVDTPIEEPQTPQFDIMGMGTGGTVPEVKPSSMPYREEIGKAARGALDVSAAVGRGAAKGVLGGPGAAEEFLAYDVPGYLGFGKTPQEKRLTVFPTPQNIGAMMEYLNLGTTPKGLQPFETTAELLGSLKTPVAQTVGKGVGAGIEKGAEKAKEAVAGITPSKTITKTFGEAKTAGEIGADIDKTIVGRLKELLKTRQKDFETVKNNYLDAGRRVQDQIRNDYVNALTKYYSENVGTKLTQDEISLIGTLVKRVGERPAELAGKETAKVFPGFETIEKERRFLDDVARGYVKPEGAEAIRAEFAKDMSNLLEGVIANRVPKEFKAFNDTYKALSEPINRYNTALGEKVTARADQYLPDIAKLDAEKIPALFFKTKETAQELKTLTGDVRLAEDFARRHLANELETIKTADQLKSYAVKNRPWLQEFPTLQAEVDRLAASVRSGEKVKNLGMILGGVGLGATGLKTLQSLSPF